MIHESTHYHFIRNTTPVLLHLEWAQKMTFQWRSLFMKQVQWGYMGYELAFLSLYTSIFTRITFSYCLRRNKCFPEWWILLPKTRCLQNINLNQLRCKTNKYTSDIDKIYRKGVGMSNSGLYWGRRYFTRNQAFVKFTAL